MDDHATNPHPRRSAGPQVSLANPSGFPLNAFGAIMADDHEVSTFDLRCIRSWLRYVPDRCARCSPQTEDNTDLRVGAVHALQGLFAGAGLCAQEEPIGRPAATEDFRERPAFDVVAGRTVKLCAQSGSPRRRAILDGLSADLWRPRGKQGWRRIYFRFRRPSGLERNCCRRGSVANDPTRTSRVDASLLPPCHGPSKCRLGQ
jgi:hypothetical protein